VSRANPPDGTPDESTGITLCMIVKDEAGLGACGRPRIERAISSALPWVDEVVVCDTGSTDGTWEILCALRDKVLPLVLYQEPWRSDFSWHRNDVASRASNDWILILDGDEEFVGDGSFLPRVLRQVAGVDSVTLPVTLVSNDNVETSIEAPRLYDRRVCQWVFPVHNQLVGLRTVGRVDGTAGFHIRSYYVGTQQAKLDRSIPLLEKMLVDYADDPVAVFSALYYLSKSYFILQDPVKVLEYTDRLSWDHLEKNPHALDVVEWAVFSTLAVRGSVAAGELVERVAHFFPTVPLVHKLRSTLALVDWYICSKGDDGLSFSQRDAMKEGLEKVPDFLRSIHCPIDLSSLKVVPLEEDPETAEALPGDEGSE
jgi:glycosyltransferase involved in cell wall biosynthesis